MDLQKQSAGLDESLVTVLIRRDSVRFLQRFVDVSGFPIPRVMLKDRVTVREEERESRNSLTDLNGTYNPVHKYITMNRNKIADLPHEVFHYYQDMLKFFERVEQQSVLLTSEAFIESGAYFFKAAFYSADKGSILKEGFRFTSDTGIPFVKECCSLIKEGKFEDPSPLDFFIGQLNGTPDSHNLPYSDPGGIFTIVTSNAIAVLAFAATDYDVKETIGLLLTDPDSIKRKISTLDNARLESLFSQIRADTDASDSKEGVGIDLRRQ